MFRSFIYLDEDKFYTYKRQLDGANPAQPKAITQKNAMGFNAALKSVGFNGSTETSISGDFERDISFDYDQFELALAKCDGEDYFDCVLNSDYDAITVSPMKILRLCSCFEVPEEFDLINVATTFMPMIVGQVPTKSATEQELVSTVFGSASADIPIVIEYDDVNISAKLNSKYLREDYSMLEDYAEQEVYMLCKVVGLIQKESVEIFDPLKDFVRLPRKARRQIDMTKAAASGIDKIIVDGPVLKVEVIAIYK